MEVFGLKVTDGSDVLHFETKWARLFVGKEHAKLTDGGGVTTTGEEWGGGGRWTTSSQRSSWCATWRAVRGNARTPLTLPDVTACWSSLTVPLVVNTRS